MAAAARAAAFLALGGRPVSHLASRPFRFELGAARFRGPAILLAHLGATVLIHRLARAGYAQVCLGSPPPMLFWVATGAPEAKGRLELVLKGKTIVTLTMMALGACTPQVAALWSKPGASYHALLQDRSACMQTARTTSCVSVSGDPGVWWSIASPNWNNPRPGGVGELPPGAALSGEVVNPYIFWTCMTARGWNYNPSAWLPS